MRYIASASMLALLVSAPLSAARAQDQETTQVEDDGSIVVTASRTGTDITELPVSASVVSEEELAEQLDYDTNVMRALEFAIPGLTPQREARGNCSPNIRGRTTA